MIKKQDIYSFFTDKSDRSNLLKKNIVFSSIIKGGSILVSFLLVPMSIQYIGEDGYGIWLTLSSVIIWLSFFDIGFSGGLRNKYAEAKALGNNILVKEYVSTTFFVLSLIFFVVWLVFILLNFFCDWSPFFKEVVESNTKDIASLLVIIVSYFCLLSVLKVLGTILVADQRPFISALIDLVGQFLCLVTIAILMHLEYGSLVMLGIVFCGSSVLVWFITNIYYFRIGKYKKICPRWKYVKMSRIKDIMNLGGQFFIIQISGLIQYQTANFIIMYYFSAKDVTYYGLSYKYFSILTMVFGMLLTPLWSAVTDAYAKKEYEWINSFMLKFLKIAFSLSAICLFMLVFSNFFLSIWLGDDVAGNINFPILFWCSIYTIIILYSAIFVNILNGMGVLKVQFILSLISPVLYIIIVYWLVGVLGWGVYAIFIALILTNINGYVAPIQYFRLMRKMK